jgi:hypothetical protein
LGRRDCLFCFPHAVPEPHADPEPEPEPDPDPDLDPDPEPDPAAGVVVGLTLLVSFIVLVYAGKVYLWLFTVATGVQCSWCAWDSLRYCTMEYLLGMLGTTMLLGCCCWSP